ncbi:MAG: cytochrome P450, partial [Candidatus Binatia bacterium]
MGFLKEYDSQFSAEKRRKLLLGWIMEHRDALFRELQEYVPIFVTPEVTLVSRYDDVREVLISDDFGIEPYRQAGLDGFVLGTEQGPAHDQERAYLDQTVRRRVYEQHELDKIRMIVLDISTVLINNARPHGYIDLATFARLVPLAVVSRYLGIPSPNQAFLQQRGITKPDPRFTATPPDLHVDLASFGIPDLRFLTNPLFPSVGNWVRAIFLALVYRTLARHLAQDPVEEDGIIALENEARRAFSRYVTAVIDRVAQRPTLTEETVLERMLLAERRTCGSTSPATRAKTIRNLTEISAAAVDQITLAVNNAMSKLLADPNILATATSAARNNDKALLLAHIWEALRFNPPVPLLARQCRRAHVLAAGTPRETLIPQGALVVAATAAAMMDPEAVHNPDEFRPNRPATDYFLFGSDPRECLGRHLAETELTEMVRNLLLLPGVRGAPGSAGQLHLDHGLPARFIITFDTPSRASAAIPHPPPAKELTVQRPLTAVMTLKQPYDTHYRALKTLLGLFFNEIRALLDRVGTVHGARFIFLENNTKLALITTYDGTFEDYINVYIEHGG